MTIQSAQTALFLLAIVAANLPWLSGRILLFVRPAVRKHPAWRWLEMLLLYILVLLVAQGMERKLNGEVYSQDWEFYVTTVCLFVVFALPGFLYRYELSRLLARKQNAS